MKSLYLCSADHNIIPNRFLSNAVFVLESNTFHALIRFAVPFWIDRLQFHFLLALTLWTLFS